MAGTLLVHNLRQIATASGVAPVRGRDLGSLRVHDDDPVMAIRDGRFVYVGPAAAIPEHVKRDVDRDLDAGGGVALPGFVDSHTHIPFAGYRESEFNRRLQGETYEQIAASGGGIASTVRSTRSATEEQLGARVLERTRWMSRYGTTTAEAKSGYGLSLDEELKQLRAIRAVADACPVRLVPTCLAAHDFPPEVGRDETRREAYVDIVAEEILPVVAREKLARFCDVFVEAGVYTFEQGKRVLEAGARAGLIPRIHADELTNTRGAELAASLGCASADHLMYISDEGIAALAASDTVANLLPATSFFLMSPRYAPARNLIEKGAIISLSTDCNPGSSFTESMQMVVQLAVMQMKITVEQAINAATINGAYSLRMSDEIGTIEAGKRADFFVIDAPSYLHLVYHFGVNLISSVFRDGQRVV